MGYRTYIASIPKHNYDIIKSMDKKKMLKHLGYEEDDYISVYNLTQELYELGKYVDEFPNELLKPFFLDKEMQKESLDGHDCYRVEKEFLENLIEHYAIKVKNYYHKMLDPFYEEDSRKIKEILSSVVTEYDKNLKKTHKFDFTKITPEQETALFKMIEHIKSMGLEWGVTSYSEDCRPYNLTNERVTDSWKYEYAQFELIRIYKSFDWDNNIMAYYGY